MKSQLSTGTLAQSSICLLISAVPHNSPISLHQSFPNPFFTLSFPTSLILLPLALAHAWHHVVIPIIHHHHFLRLSSCSLLLSHLSFLSCFWHTGLKAGSSQAQIPVWYQIDFLFYSMQLWKPFLNWYMKTLQLQEKNAVCSDGWKPFITSSSVSSKYMLSFKLRTFKKHPKKGFLYQTTSVENTCLT